jgi:hypothetical protein
VVISKRGHHETWSPRNVVNSKMRSPKRGYPQNVVNSKRGHLKTWSPQTWSPKRGKH